MLYDFIWRNSYFKTGWDEFFPDVRRWQYLLTRKTGLSRSWRLGHCLPRDIEGTRQRNDIGL